MVIVLFVAYLLGSIPYGVICTYLFTGKNVKQHGSGNIGATNTLRSAGKIPALLTLLGDTLKGFIAVYIGIQQGCAEYAAIAVLLGHMFPVWLKFRGGKGVATMLGILFAVSWDVGILAFIAWVGFFFFTRISSVASLLSICSVAATVWIWGFTLPINITTFMILSLLIIIKHKDNIGRLLQGKESPITKEKK